MNVTTNPTTVHQTARMARAVQEANLVMAKEIAVNLQQNITN